jgi:hypothetical protein
MQQQQEQMQQQTIEDLYKLTIRKLIDYINITR